MSDYKMGQSPILNNSIIAFTVFVNANIFRTNNMIRFLNIHSNNLDEKYCHDLYYSLKIFIYLLTASNIIVIISLD